MKIVCLFAQAQAKNEWKMTHESPNENMKALIFPFSETFSGSLFQATEYYPWLSKDGILQVQAHSHENKVKQSLQLSSSLSKWSQVTWNIYKGLQHFMDES